MSISTLKHKGNWSIDVFYVFRKATLLLHSSFPIKYFAEKHCLKIFVLLSCHVCVFTLQFLWRNGGPNSNVHLIHSIWANFQTSTSNVSYLGLCYMLLWFCDITLSGDPIIITGNGSQIWNCILLLKLLNMKSYNIIHKSQWIGFVQKNTFFVLSIFARCSLNFIWTGMSFVGKCFSVWFKCCQLDILSDAKEQYNLHISWSVQYMGPIALSTHICDDLFTIWYGLIRSTRNAIDFMISA